MAFKDEFEPPITIPRASTTADEIAKAESKNDTKTTRPKRFMVILLKSKKSRESSPKAIEKMPCILSTKC
jgi:hypothetical protein